MADISQGDTTNATSAREEKARTGSSSAGVFLNQGAMVVSHPFSESIKPSEVTNKIEKEIEFIEKAMESGPMHMLGEAEVVSHPKSSFLNKIVVNYAYSFLRNNFRDGDSSVAIPHNRLLKVGMTYEI